ncbi:hypothetical protein BH11PAT1_BH11PAT1_6210 [soil metagenome]
MDKTLPTQTAQDVSVKDEKILLTCIAECEKAYKEVIEDVAPMVNHIAAFLPRRRERVQHVGLFGYSRGVGKVKLPRAISFTGSLYSIGIPPEFIGTGRGLKKIAEEGNLEIVKLYYKNIKKDLERAGGYLNKDVLNLLSQKYTCWQKIAEDVKAIESLFGIELGPKTESEKMHKELTDVIYEKVSHDENPMDLLTEAGMIRKSMG